jgi:hypothetical protein
MRLFYLKDWTWFVKDKNDLFVMVDFSPFRKKPCHLEKIRQKICYLNKEERKKLPCLFGFQLAVLRGQI